MNIKKPALILGAASLISVGGLAGTGIVSAASGNGSGSTSLVDAIATKFHLNKSEVQSVVDQNRAEHEAEHQKKFESRLDQAVTDGKITSAQKTQILAKEKELKSYMESLKDKTPQERHKLMKAKLDALKTWAKQNGIPSQYVMFGPGGPGHHGGPGMDDDQPGQN